MGPKKGRARPGGSDGRRPCPEGQTMFPPGGVEQAFSRGKPEEIADFRRVSGGKKPSPESVSPVSDPAFKFQLVERNPGGTRKAGGAGTAPVALSPLRGRQAVPRRGRLGARRPRVAERGERSEAGFRRKSKISGGNREAQWCNRKVVRVACLREAQGSRQPGAERRRRDA